MILQFPDFDTLRLVLTSGVVPPAVSLEPAVAGVDDDGRPWVDTPAKLPRTITNQLSKLGVTSLKTYPALGEDLNNWLQALPLEREDKAPELGNNAPVLFELPGPAQLPEIVGEMLRLSVDRQSFRWMKDDETGAGPVLLRVVGPPYYTLLRALDRERAGGGGQVRAYLEQAPQVWVEIGWTHPLVKSLAPREGQLLLLRAPRGWIFLADAPFRDIYEILDFKLPQSRLDWHASELKKRLIVPLRLIDSDRHDIELWVLRDNAVDQLDALVRDAKDGLLHRLIFAVGQHEGKVTIVLRVRPSKQPPPQLVLQAEAYSKYLKLDNLFVPHGTKIHPVLRRDAIRKLLADDPAQINWLRANPHKAGAFIPESLPDEAFRPLHEWVDYVLDHDRAALTSWVQEFRFDFEPFLCTEEAADPKPKGPPDRGKRKPGEEDEVETRTPRAAPPTKRRETSFRVEKDDFAEIEILPPTQLQEELAAFEKQFLEMPAALDDPARLPLWPEMATRNAALKNSADAAVCWMNLLWELLDLHAEADDVRRDSDPNRRAARQERLDRLLGLLANFGGEEELAWQWVRSEAYFNDRVDKKFAGLLAVRQLTTAHLDELLKIDAPAPHEVRALLACVIWGALNSESAAALTHRVAPILHFIQKHEKMAPVRAVWLAWNSLTRLSGDMLGLARVRDRLLERLVADGLSPERDLPNLLRNAGHHDSERMRVVRTHVNRLHELARHWYIECENQVSITNSRKRSSSAYFVDLIFAYGMARLGESSRARELLKKAEAELKVIAKADEEFDQVHAFLFVAFQYRIEQALSGKPLSGSLPTDMLDQLDKVLPAGNNNTNRYIVDRMLEKSNILEPIERNEPYRNFRSQPNSDIDSRLVKLSSIREPRSLLRETQSLLGIAANQNQQPELEVYVLAEVLPIAPRVSEQFAFELIQRVEELYKKKSPGQNPTVLAPMGKLIQRALLIAGNYERADTVKRIWPLLVQLLQTSQKSNDPNNDIVQPFAQCLRSMRRLGMRDEIGALLEQAESIISKGKSLKTLQYEAANDWKQTLNTLLHLASGWMSNGNFDKAREVLDIAWARLSPESELKGMEFPAYTTTAATYASVLGQAPIEVAIRRIEQMFTHMRLITDNFLSNRCYARMPLTIIEAVVLAVVHEDFGMGPGARRWMDDDEFLVRRRIHRDHRSMLAKG